MQILAEKREFLQLENFAISTVHVFTDYIQSSCKQDDVESPTCYESQNNSETVRHHHRALQATEVQRVLQRCKLDALCTIFDRLEQLGYFKSKSKTHCNWLSVLVSSLVWVSRPDIYYSLTVTVLLLWGILSDERAGMSFVYAAGPSHCTLFRVRVPWDSWPHFTLSDLTLPFSSPPTTRRATVEVFKFWILKWVIHAASKRKLNFPRVLVSVHGIWIRE
jgi:hypothetical protein